MPSTDGAPPNLVRIATVPHTVAAPPKIGKSYLAAQLCVCLASGQPFLGLTIPRAARVGVFTLELAAGPYRERVEALCADVGLPVPRWNEGLHVVAPNAGDVPRIDLEAEGHVEAIFTDAAKAPERFYSRRNRPPPQVTGPSSRRR